MTFVKLDEIALNGEASRRGVARATVRWWRGPVKRKIASFTKVTGGCG